VDFIYDRLSVRKRAWIDILGTLFFLMPLAVVVIYGSWPFVIGAYSSGEISQDPGGLHYRWLIKGMIPLSFVFLIFCALDFMLHNLNVLRGAEEPMEEERDEL